MEMEAVMLMTRRWVMRKWKSKKEDGEDEEDDEEDDRSAAMSDICMAVARVSCFAGTSLLFLGNFWVVAGETGRSFFQNVLIPSFKHEWA